MGNDQTVVSDDGKVEYVRGESKSKLLQRLLVCFILLSVFMGYVIYLYEMYARELNQKIQELQLVVDEVKRRESQERYLKVREEKSRQLREMQEQQKQEKLEK